MIQSFSSSSIQSNLFDFTPDGIINEAIQRADDNADKEWKEEATKMLYELCLRKREITVDDLRDVLTHHTHNNSALGAIMRFGARANWTQMSGYAKSTDPKKHKRIIAVWTSLIYTPPTL